MTRAVQAIRNIVRSPAVKREIERGNDTALAFALRATNHIVSGSRPPRDTVNLLWVLDQPALNQMLGIPQNSRMKVWPKKPPAR
jgi:hypothetical protein